MLTTKKFFLTKIKDSAQSLLLRIIARFSMGKEKYRFFVSLLNHFEDETLPLSKRVQAGERIDRLLNIRSEKENG